MKKFLFSLAALCVLLLTSCKKESLSFGKYAAETRDGVLTVDLVNENDCIFQFEGGEAANGGYYIKNQTIHFWCNIIYPSTNHRIWWWFEYNNTYGKINHGSFCVRAIRNFYDESRVFDITFNPVAGI